MVQDLLGFSVAELEKILLTGLCLSNDASIFFFDVDSTYSLYKQLSIVHITHDTSNSGAAERI